MLGSADANARAGALTAIAALATELSCELEPFIMPMLANVLELYGDKQRFVKEAHTAPWAGDCHRLAECLLGELTA